MNEYEQLTSKFYCAEGVSKKHMESQLGINSEQCPNSFKDTIDTKDTLVYLNPLYRKSMNCCVVITITQFQVIKNLKKVLNEIV